MSRPLTPEEADYSRRLFNLVLDAVIGMDAVEGTNGGLVHPDIVRVTLADVAATVDCNAGFGRSPRERRETGEVIGRRYATLLKTLQDSPEAAWTPAIPIAEGGRPN